MRLLSERVADDSQKAVNWMASWPNVQPGKLEIVGNVIPLLSEVDVIGNQCHQQLVHTMSPVTELTVQPYTPNKKFGCCTEIKQHSVS